MNDYEILNQIDRNIKEEIYKGKEACRKVAKVINQLDDFADENLGAFCEIEKHKYNLNDVFINLHILLNSLIGFIQKYKGGD